MTSLNNDYSNNIIDEAINISNKLKNLIQKLNEKNNNIIVDKTDNKKILLPAGASSHMLTNNKTNIRWKSSLRN